MPQEMDFLAGGGEMAAAIAELDWSKTPLGPIEKWPQSLKTATSMMLASKFAMVIAWGPEFIFLYNDRYVPILGSKPVALGKPAAEVVPEVWDDIVGPLFRKATTEEAIAVDDLLVPLVRKGFLEECYFTLTYSPIRVESGGVGGLLAVVVETTERVHGERGLRTLRGLASCAAHADSEERALRDATRVLVEGGDTPFALGYLVDETSAYARLVACEGVEATHDIAPLHLALGDSGRWPLHAGRPLELVGNLVGLPCHTAAVLPIGRPGLARPYGFVVLGTNPRRELDDRYRRFFALAADHIAAGVSNARAHEVERRRAEQLAAIDRAKTAFFSNISHEFRTPLTLMLGPTEDALASPEKCLRGDDLAAVHRNELRLLKLVNALLDFARLEAGRVDACYRPTDLPRLTSDLASTFQSAIERAHLALEVACEPLGEPVFVDDTMWEKIVLNLISNAFKFTFEGGIRVSLAIEGDAVVLRVRDTGIGVPAEELPRLFEQFHRVQGAKSRTHEGSGIGLALVHELARLHGGSVSVDSTLGVGSTFTVTIPRGSAHLPQDRVSTQPALASTGVTRAAFAEETRQWLPDASAVAVSAEGASARVLVVDDNGDMREYLRRILAPHFTVETANDGLAALSVVSLRRPHVVVSDVMMPGLDGFGLLRELRKLDGAVRIPVILLSARAGEEARIEGIDAGADDYIVKPFSAKELIARVRTQSDLTNLRAQSEAERSHLQHKVAIVATLNRIGRSLNAGLDLHNILQIVTDEATRLCAARFGTFFYNVTDEREGATVYTVAGAPHDAFAKFALPRNTPLFDASFRGQVVRSDDIREDPRYGKNPQYNGMPDCHLPVVSYLAVPVLSARGRVLGGLFFGHDQPAMFTAEHEQLLVAIAAQAATAVENARLYEEAQQARRDAEAASRAKDEFFAILGHELRNPLAPIKTALHLMGLEPTARFERERGIIERQVDHVVRLVDDLLDVSRITRGRVELRKQLLDVGEILARTLETAGALFMRDDHQVVTTIEPTLIVEGDETRLTQVFTNLITNAAKYTPRCGRIEISAQRDGDKVVIRVRDNGIGIDADMLPHVFELFAQERQSLARSNGGLGLGLTIVHSMIQLHGGTVTAHSDGRGRGAEFVVRLPASRYVALPSKLEAASAIVDTKRLRVLVVDDNVDAAELLAESLRVLGYDTAVAFDGPEAIHVAASFKPQIALLDIGLPNMDGYELARRLADSPDGRPRLLVAISGYGLDADRVKSKEAGFAEHLIKPIRVHTLRELLANADRQRLC